MVAVCVFVTDDGRDGGDGAENGRMVPELVMDSGEPYA